MYGIIWLASYPKSGNTWLRAFLANYFRDPPRPVPINDLPFYALGDSFLIHYRQYSCKTIDELGEEEIHRLRPLIHRWFAAGRGETVFVKTHNMIGEVAGIPLITPEATAGAIYMVRHPFDVAVSFAHHYQISVDRAVEALCREDNFLPGDEKILLQYLGSWAQHVLSWTTAPRLKRHVMRYEDMQASPTRAFGALIRFLGLPADRARLRKAIRFSSFEQVARQEWQGGFLEARPDGKSRFFRRGQSGEGQAVLSAAQRARLLHALGPAMARFGYLDPAATPHP